MHPIERKIVSAVVTAALEAGYTVSVEDDETGYFVRRSADHAAIVGELGHMDEDVIRIHDETTGSKGFFHFVYGNEPHYVIADYADRPACSAIMAKVQPIIDAHEDVETWCAEKIIQERFGK